MTRRYTHEDAQFVKDFLSGMLRRVGVHCQTGVYNDGHTLGAVLSNKKGTSRLYEFGLTDRGEEGALYRSPDLTTLGLAQMATDWRSGDLDPTAAPPPHTVPPGSAAHQVKTREEFITWLRDAKPNAQALYHRGSLANWRKDAPARLVELQRLSDAATHGKPRPIGESVEMQQIQDHLDLIAAVTAMEAADMVRLTQRRAVEGDSQFIYYAVKKGR